MANKDSDAVKALQKQIKALQKQVRLEKGKLEREELFELFDPLFDAMDIEVTCDDFQKFLADKDAIRVYFHKADGEDAYTVKRDSFYPYKSKAFTGGGNAGGNGGGRAVEIDMDGKGNWQEFASGAAACRHMGFETNGANAHAVLASKLPDGRVRSVSENGGG